MTTVVSVQAPDQTEPDKADLPLLALREDISLLPGTRNWDGESTWTISDPLRNRFFQIGERDRQILQYWRAGTAAQVVAAVTAAEGLELDIDDVLALQHFLLASELVDAKALPLRMRLVNLHKAREQTLLQQLLHKYLFFRVPLLRPDRFLNALYPRVRFVFQPWFIRLTVLIGILGMVLVGQSWNRFAGGFGWFLTPMGMAVLSVTLVGVKILHEMGHALMCKHFGLRVPTMGVAFLVMWPVLYTDASESWRLVSRHQRAMIAAAGVVTEMMLACYAMVIWFLLPDGLARSVAFSVATTTWVLSVAVNFSPFVRFDGYYFLSDMVNIPSLQERSFVVARWRLRQWLFGFEAPAPEPFPEKTLAWMMVYAWATWVYRFFLFLGIAVLVYYLFFKALGIFLFMVEIGWFLVKPIWSEVKHWRELAPNAGLLRKRLFVGAAMAALLLLVFPWKSSVELPALLSAARHTRVFLPADAQVLAVHVKDGMKVRAGDSLVVLRAPELELKIRLAAAEINRLDSLLASSAMQADLYKGRLVFEQQRAQASAERQALEREQAQLTVRAPFDGVVRDIDSELALGRWLAASTHLLTVVAPAHAEVTAWLSEDDRDRVHNDAHGVFWSEVRRGPQGVNVEMRIIDTTAVRDLDPPFVASVFGGDIMATESAEGALVPEKALYRVRLQVTDTVDEDMVAQRWRGRVVIEGERRSMLVKGATWLVGALIRESGL